MDESFESWAYRKGYYRQIERLRSRGFVETVKTEYRRTPFVRLTKSGRLLALGGRDPEVAWEQQWDGVWRLISFDLPKAEHSLRKQVDRCLKGCCLGHLQGSLWVSPLAVSALDRFLAERGKDCSHFITLKAFSGGKRMDRRIVEAAWNFDFINQHYEHEIEILGNLPRGGSRLRHNLLQWSKTENEIWLKAINSDPLLPKTLHPRGYLGIKAWNLRRKTLAEAGHLANRAMFKAS